MTHRSTGPEAKTVEYLKSKEKKPTLPEESVALQGLVFCHFFSTGGIFETKILHLKTSEFHNLHEIENDFAEIEEIWNEPEHHFVCLITPEVFLFSTQQNHTHHLRDHQQRHPLYHFEMSHHNFHHH